MTPEQQAYTATFYEGLIARLQMEATRALFGEDSHEFSMASARHEANVHLAHESLHEIPRTATIASAGWEGWLDGVQRFAAVGSPSFPEWMEETAPEEPPYQRTVVELFYDELDGWMREFYGDLPLCLELILDKNITELEHPAAIEETWSFFKSIAEGVDDTTGNFGDGFSDDDRKRINEYVNGDIHMVAEAVKHAMGLSGRTWPIVG